MAGVNVGGGGGKRSVNQEINMIPFIDLLLVTIAFLLITAVWVTHSRINANAQLPGPGHGPTVTHPAKDLHLYSNPTEFVLTWKQGSTVISESRMERKSIDGSYPDLADKITEEWNTHGAHKDASDRAIDRCVFHSDNQEPFSEVVAVMDAIYNAKREMILVDGQRRKVPVFNMAFASR
jgi:biopolymer transport protein ExbD